MDGYFDCKVHETHEPVTVNIGSVLIFHGERDDCPACLCGVPYYLDCPSATGDGSLFGVTITRDGVYDDAPRETR
jgi:hypothetical protein